MKAEALAIVLVTAGTGGACSAHAPSPPPSAAGPHLNAKTRANLDALVAAYPDFLASHDDTELVWKDGTRMPLFDEAANKTPTDILANPSIADIFAWPYPAGAPVAQPAPNADPGRARPTAFFAKMYGNCRANEVAAKLVSIPWVDGTTVLFTPVNGADKALAGAARELGALGPSFKKYLVPSSGTYNCRAIAGTGRMSMHAFGAAIDLNASEGEYWRWGDAALYRDRIPIEIVRVFEKHGFIWGGRWAHFDTIHFEYRPELILAAARTP